MPQAASTDNDHAHEPRQTGQKFHHAQSNKPGAAGQPSIFKIYWFDAVLPLSLFLPDGIKNPVFSQLESRV
jgi:hypothetical protein